MLLTACGPMRRRSICQKLNSQDPQIRIGDVQHMKTLVFLRHGETDWNAQGRYQGQTDILLNDTGRIQAREAALRWGHTEFDAAIVSPLARAHETGRIILGDRDLDLVTVEEVQETHGGEWEGLVFSKIAERWPDEHAAFRLPSVDAGPVGGETPRQSGTRTADAVLASLTDADVLLVISHGNTLRAAAHVLIGHDDEDYATVPRLENCRAHVLQSNSGESGSFTLTQTSV